MNNFRIDGKVALVTGCKRGIGKAFAEALAEAGADIIGVSATLEKENSEVEKLVKALGKNFYSYACDFSDRKSLYNFINKVKSEHCVDILINNAGTIYRREAENHDDENWDKVMDVNLNSQFILAREFGKEMLKVKSGKIVFTASLLSFQGGITVPSYSASKGGLLQLTKALSNEWAAHGVNVNAIVPGYIATDNTKALRENNARNKSILERIPADKWGTPEDLKGTVVFLSSPASNYIHGTSITVDGGWMAR